MKRIFTLLGVVALSLILTACGKPSEKDLIVGKWEVKEDEGTMSMDFAKDGKFVMGMNAGGINMTMEGTYKVDGKTLTIAMKDAGVFGTATPPPATIVAIDKESLTLSIDEGGGAETKTLKRVK